MKNLDIFFLSFNETNREKNWSLLKKYFPHSRRLHGIKGIGLAHGMCARLSKTPFFFIVNGDNEICHKTFSFKLPEFPLKERVYCWRSKNPVNNLIYGFGGIKLFPKAVFQNLPLGVTDLSTSLKIPYRIVEELGSVTRFNVSPLEAFRGAFRECVKLSSHCIHNQKDRESRKRLHIWRHKGKDKPFGSFVLLGALHGENYGRKYKNNRERLKRINDFQWIKDYFLKATVKTKEKTLEAFK